MSGNKKRYANEGDEPILPPQVVQEVSAFKTEDGSLHDTLEEAIAFDRRMKFRRWCGENICIGGEWDADMVAREILENWDVKYKL